MKITVAWLQAENACSDAVKFVAPLLGEGIPLSECLPQIARADWLIWLLWHSKSVNIRQLIKLACVAGRQSLRHVPMGEDRPRLAYESVEKWIEHPSGAAGDAARAAWAAAGAAAGDAARAAAWAAAWAAWAAAGAAAGDAARAAGDAVRAAAWAAWAAGDAAGAAEHRVMCDLIRAELEKPEFLALEWPISKEK